MSLAAITVLQGTIASAAGHEVEADEMKPFAPGKTNITHCVNGIYRDSEVLGADAEMFEEMLVRMQRTVDIVFGHGKYMCF